MIELNQVSKRFGERWAVDQLTLGVPAGEIYGLLGHNGAGKSTAIGMMLGQVWPTGGEVKVCGFEVGTHRSQALRRVGAIFESPAFYDYLSGWRNLEILSSYTAPTSRRRLAEVIEWVGLSGREHSKVRTYSHGMRARLALAQALLPDPQLLILDEPSDGLDPEGIHEMRKTILRLHGELGLTILLSSHFLNEVEQLCTRIAVLNQGKKVFEGALAETRQKENWIRLSVDDLERAWACLQNAGLVTARRNCNSESLDNTGATAFPSSGQTIDGTKQNGAATGLVLLTDGAGTEQLVRTLVQNQLAVYEIARHEQTLEDFYLSLMGQQRAGVREDK
jgi:ABC-2 type transport system ATP-binding protein